jgi:hypothetical protein
MTTLILILSLLAMLLCEPRQCRLFFRRISPSPSLPASESPCLRVSLSPRCTLPPLTEDDRL